jgi:carbonic anhydrase
MGVKTEQGFLEPANRLAKGKADALVLTCIDYRYLHVIPEYLHQHNPSLSYDHTILAGASLGVFAGIYPGWASTFWEHLEVAIALHRIHTVFILDHRDCGAYREFEALPEAPAPKSPDYPKYLDLERTIHKHYMDRLGALITKSHSKLKIITDLLDVPKSP